MKWVYLPFYDSLCVRCSPCKLCQFIWVPRIYYKYCFNNYIDCIECYTDIRSFLVPVLMANIWPHICTTPLNHELLTHIFLRQLPFLLARVPEHTYVKTRGSQEEMQIMHFSSNAKLLRNLPICLSVWFSVVLLPSHELYAAVDGNYVWPQKNNFYFLCFQLRISWIYPNLLSKLHFSQLKMTKIDIADMRCWFGLCTANSAATPHKHCLLQGHDSGT